MTFWKQENKKYLKWILGINAIAIGIEVIVVFLNGYRLSELFLSKPNILSNLNLIVVPLMAVNILFLTKQLGHKYKQEPTKWFILKMIGLTIGVCLGTGVLETLGYAWGIEDDDFIALGEYTLSASLTNFIENTIISYMIGIPIFYKESLTDKIAKKLKDKEIELEKVYKLKVESELAAIHAKINPHFLYNALNSIVNLIHFDPDKAEKMVLSLSDLFRYSINSSENHFASLKEEINLVKTYLQIEHVRFQDQLKYEIDVPEDLHSVQIPKFLIQPWIENAIKHGTSHITQGSIILKVTQVNDCIQISISDNGPRFPENIDSGYGLKSTIDKLDLLYKGNYSLKIINEPQKQILIELKNKIL